MKAIPAIAAEQVLYLPSDVLLKKKFTLMLEPCANQYLVALGLYILPYLDIEPRDCCRSWLSNPC